MNQTIRPNPAETPVAATARGRARIGSEELVGFNPPEPATIRATIDMLEPLLGACSTCVLPHSEHGDAASLSLYVATRTDPEDGATTDRDDVNRCLAGSWNGRTRPILEMHRDGQGVLCMILHAPQGIVGRINVAGAPPFPGDLRDGPPGAGAERPTIGAVLDMLHALDRMDVVPPEEISTYATRMACLLDPSDVEGRTIMGFTMTPSATAPFMGMPFGASRPSMAGGGEILPPAENAALCDEISRTLGTVFDVGGVITSGPDDVDPVVAFEFDFMPHGVPIRKVDALERMRQHLAMTRECGHAAPSDGRPDEPTGKGAEDPS